MEGKERLLNLCKRDSSAHKPFPQQTVNMKPHKTIVNSTRTPNVSLKSYRIKYLNYFGDKNIYRIPASTYNPASNSDMGPNKTNII